MKIEVNISKGKFFIILASILILAGAILSIAYDVLPGELPNPGHPLSGIQGYFSGDSNIYESLSKFCQSDGTNCENTYRVAGFDHNQIINTSGTSVWTVPAGVTAIQVEVYGAGGGGGGSGATSNGYDCYGGTGGNGGYGRQTLTVSPGQTFTVVVGALGQGGQNKYSSIGGSIRGSTTDGSSGGSSSFTGGSTSMVSYGGVGGLKSNVTNCDTYIESTLAGRFFKGADGKGIATYNITGGGSVGGAGGILRPNKPGALCDDYSRNINGCFAPSGTVGKVSIWW